MKKTLEFLLISLVVAGFYAVAHAAVSPNKTDFQTYCIGSNNSNCVYRVDSAGDIHTNGQLALIGLTASAQSALTTAPNQAFQIPVQISATGSSAVQGSVVLTTAPINNLVTGYVTTSAADTRVLGVADGTIATGSYGLVDFSGIAVILTTGTVNPGDLLVSTNTVAGYAAANNSASNGTIIGTALSAGTVSGGLTRVLLNTR